MKKEIVLLSYILSPELSAYGDGEKFKRVFTKHLDCGDSCNNSELHFNAHLGTHIDFPYHFSNEGKKAGEYDPSAFVFENVAIAHVPKVEAADKLIHPSDLESALTHAGTETELLLIVTDYFKIRYDRRYWELNPGLAPESAAYLKGRFKKLRCVGLDSISISSWTNRPAGREAHKTFLLENDLLLIEDVTFENLSLKEKKISRVWLGPLLMKDADSAPTSIFAEVVD